MKTESMQSESFRIDKHGDIRIIVPSTEVESMAENLINQAADMVLAPLRSSKDPPAGLIIDLSEVNYFGSVFLGFLLRCHLLAKKQDIELVLVGPSERARELLHLTALDTLWAIYKTRTDAIREMTAD